MSEVADSRGGEIRASAQTTLAHTLMGGKGYPVSLLVRRTGEASMRCDAASFFRKTATDAAMAGWLAAAGGTILRANPLGLQIGSQTSATAR